MSLIDRKQEKKLICLLAKGNQVAFKTIFDYYHARIFFFSKKYLRSDYLAEEAVQDIFLRIWEKREELLTVENFEAWLLQLSRNYLLNILKKASTENKIKEKIGKTIQTTTSYEDDHLIEKERSDTLFKVMASLPAQRKEVFRLCRIEEKSYDEVAQMMGISKSTVNDHMVKAMKHLKNNFPKNSYR
jgi:RNA polymerase sigma-70 factor (ECF subfamily)